MTSYDDSESEEVEEESFEEELENTDLDEDIPKFIRLEDWIE
jgi:hypothetical protein